MIPSNKPPRISDEEIYLSLLDHVNQIDQEELIESCLRDKTIESLMIRNKRRSLRANYIHAYELILNMHHREANSSCIVDVCSGLGYLTLQFRKQFSNIIGLECNSAYLDFSRKASTSRALPVEYREFNINDFPSLHHVFALCSVFGINVAKDKNKVISKILEILPEYIIIFDGHCKNVYSRLKSVVGIQTRQLDFDLIEERLAGKYRTVLRRNIHTIPSFLIDLPLIGGAFERLNRFLRKFDMFAVSILLIAERK